MRRAQHIFTAAGYLLVALCFVPVVVHAIENSSKNISSSYNTESELQAGSIVSAVSGKAEYVEAANTANASRVLGVVVKPDSSLLAVNPDTTKAQVGTSGTVSVLVSTVNGDIKTGDKIAPSPFSGVGMKAVGNSYIVGAALAGFNRASEGATAQQVTDKSGNKQTVTVGFVPIDVTPRYDSTLDGAGLNGVQRFIRSLTGHTVSTPRIIVSLVIAVLTVVAIMILMYAAIYGSIVSIGRNPLARISIFRALSRVVGMAILIFIIAFGLIYFLLR